MTTMILLSMVLTLTTLSLATSDVRFKAGAIERVDVKYSPGKSLSEMTISFNPEEVVESGGRLSVEIRTAGGCWREAYLIRDRAQESLWRVDVFPCLEVETRLVLNNGDCVELYELYYVSEDRQDSGSLELSSGNTENVNITGMDLDMEYSITIDAKMGEGYNSVTTPRFNPLRLEARSVTTVAPEETLCSERNVCQPKLEPKNIEDIKPRIDPQPDISSVSPPSLTGLGFLVTLSLLCLL